MTTNGFDHDFMHHGLVRALNVLAMVLTLLVIAYGLINPPATLFPLSNMVIVSGPQVPRPASTSLRDSTKDAPGAHVAGNAVPDAGADDPRRCARDKGVADDCTAR
jgi:hypothetical protein